MKSSNVDLNWRSAVNVDWSPLHGAISLTYTRPRWFDATIAMCAYPSIRPGPGNNFSQISGLLLRKANEWAIAVVCLLWCWTIEINTESQLPYYLIGIGLSSSEEPIHAADLWYLSWISQTQQSVCNWGGISCCRAKLPFVPVTKMEN
jgi:hypothetical protein